MYTKISMAPTPWSRDGNWVGQKRQNCPEIQAYLKPEVFAGVQSVGRSGHGHGPPGKNDQAGFQVLKLKSLKG